MMMKQDFQSGGAAARLTRLAMAGVVAGLGLSAAAPAASAESFLAGKSKGMTKCVRAILGGYEVKKVNVHGHHFNCKPLLRKIDSRGGLYRQIWLSHAQRGKDDQIYSIFYVDSPNVIVPNSLRFRVRKGISIKTFKPGFEFRGPAYLPDYQSIAELARAMKPVKVKNWQTAAKQIAIVVIAELGNPENRGTALKQVNCTLPTFYEHDNFRGRSYRLGGSQPNFHKVLVSGKHMGDVISSMCLPRGWRVTAYTLPDYKGISYDFSGPRAYEDLQRQDAANGQRLNWGDKISSVRVSRR